MKLSHKLLLVFAVLLLGMAAASLFGILRLNQSLSVYAHEVQAANDHESAISRLLALFKSQTQEWKDTLLRGKDPQAREKYWTAFKKDVAEIHLDAGKLVESLPDGEPRAMVARFAEAEVTMAKSYADGFQAFTVADFDPSAGDRAVKGIDREPGRLLGEAANKIAAVAAAVSADAEAAGKHATWISLGLMVGAAFAGLVSAIALSRSVLRQFGADPADVAALVQRVAAGDLAVPVTLKLGDSNSVMCTC